MKLSFKQKIKLSFAVEGPYVKLCTTALPLIYLSWLLVGDPDSLEMSNIFYWVGMPFYGLCLSVYLMVSYNFQGIRFLKTLPVTNNDISDISAIGLVTTSASAVLSQTALTALTSHLFLMPYFLCMDAALTAIASAYAPFYMKTNYTRLIRADEAEYKKKTTRAIITMIVYFIAGAAVSTLIICQAVKNDISSAGIWLAVISVMSMIIFVSSMIVCHRINISVEC
ncbi:MAG: hypothetical protein J1E40_12090 [Oscillospiraceae bacterium]|nr:hypothetical protein [Oscillospiraceae bacterium]